jgi:hypothetical protein
VSFAGGVGWRVPNSLGNRPDTIGEIEHGASLRAGGSTGGGIGSSGHVGRPDNPGKCVQSLNNGEKSGEHLVTGCHPAAI